MDVNKLHVIYFCNSNFWYVFEVPIKSIYNLCHEIRSSFNHIISKRKANFGTPEKENKCPKTFGTPPASCSYRDEWKNRNPWLRYDAKSKAMFCDFCIKYQPQNIFTEGYFVFISKIISEDIEISD